MLLKFCSAGAVQTPSCCPFCHKRSDEVNVSHFLPGLYGVINLECGNYFRLLLCKCHYFKAFQEAITHCSSSHIICRMKCEEPVKSDDITCRESHQYTVQLLVPHSLHIFRSKLLLVSLSLSLSLYSSFSSLVNGLYLFVSAVCMESCPMGPYLWWFLSNLLLSALRW